MDKMHSSKAQTSEISFNEALVLKDYQCSIVHPVSVQPLGTFKLKKKKTQKKGKSFWKINIKYKKNCIEEAILQVKSLMSIQWKN